MSWEFGFGFRYGFEFGFGWVWFEFGLSLVFDLGFWSFLFVLDGFGSGWFSVLGFGYGLRLGFGLVLGGVCFSIWLV